MGGGTQMNEQTNDNSVTVEAPDYQPIATAMTNCCTDQLTHAGNVLTAETAAVTVADLVVDTGQEDDDGNPITITIPGASVDPRFVGAFMQQQQSAQQQLQTAAYQSQYQSWLDQWESYQDLQVVPYFIQMGLALAQMVEAYGVYNDCLGVAKTSKDRVAAELVAMTECVGQLRDQICPHLDALGADNAMRITSFNNSVAMAEMMKEQQLTQQALYIAAEDGDEFRVEQNHDKAFSLICQGHASAATLKIYADNLEAYFNELLAHDVDAPVADAIKALVAKVNECQEWLKECADNLQADYDENYAIPAANMSEVVMNESNVLVQGLSDITTFLNGCQATLKTHWETVHQAAETVNVELLTTEATNLIPRFTMLHDDVLTCIEDHQAMQDAYTAQETCLGPDAIAQGCAALDDFLTVRTDLNTCSDERKAQYAAAYEGKESTFATASLTLGCGALANVEAWTEDLDACAEERKATYTAVYNAGETALQQAVLASAAALVPCAEELHAEMLTCAGERKAQYNAAYMAKESALVTTVMTEACTFSTCMTEIKDDMLACADERKSTYDGAYKGKEEALSAVALQEACALMPCLADVHEWLCTQADCMDAHWLENWKANEGQYAATLLQKGVDRHCNLDEDLEKLCDEADYQLQKWRDAYEAAECATHQKIIEAGERACEKHEEFYNYVCDEMQHLWTKFEDEWCVCDVQDLQEVCAIWEKCHPIDELCENHECQQEVAQLLAQCYKDEILPCEKRYILEVCDSMKYVPQLCEMETTALLQIRKQFDRQRERLIKGSSRWCHGATKEQLSELYRQQAAAESAAIAAANRYEKWWEVQECDRRHRYYMDVLTNLGKRMQDQSQAAFQQDNVLLDQLLGRLHDRLLRGYEYVRNWNDSARSVMGATSNAMSASHESARVGQFHVQRYQDMRADYNRSSLGYMSSVENTMRIGQFLPAHAAQDKNQAAQVASQAVQHGQRAIDHGHWQLDMYLRGQSAGAQIAQQGVAFGHQAIDQGHNQLQLYRAGLVDAAQVTQAMIDDGTNAVAQGHQQLDMYLRGKALAVDSVHNQINESLQTVQHGHNQLRMYLEGKNMAGRMAAESIQYGLNAVQQGHFWPEMMLREKNLCYEILSAVSDDALQSYNVGLSHVGNAIAAAQEARQATNVARQAGEDAAGRGLRMQQLAAEKVDGAMRVAAGAISQGNDFLRVGLNAAQIAAQGHSSSLQSASVGYNAWNQLVNQQDQHTLRAAEFNNSSRAGALAGMDLYCKYLQQNYQIMSGNYLTQGLNMVNAAGNIFQGSRAGFNAAASDFLGGVSGLNQPPSLPNAPFSGSNAITSVPSVGVSTSSTGFGSFTNGVSGFGDFGVQAPGGTGLGFS